MLVIRSSDKCETVLILLKLITKIAVFWRFRNKL